VPIRLDANLEFPDDLAAARYAGAEGIGLYRSEFLVASGVEDIRDEDRQYEIYRRMLEGMAPGMVTVRTFDVDEEQLSARLSQHPFAAGWEPDEPRGSRLGLRGLRLSLMRPICFACSCGRCCGRRVTAGSASCFRSCRAWSRSAKRARWWTMRRPISAGGVSRFRASPSA